MVDITDRLEKIKAQIDNGDYFTINRARQYGKTTTIRAVTDYLKDEYIVVPLDFQRMENDDFATGTIFSKAFVWYLLRIIRNRRNPVKGFSEKKHFLAQLRSYYLDRGTSPTFQSVILAGVYDVKNIELKIRSDSERIQSIS